MRVLFLSNAPIMGGTARILRSWLLLGRKDGWQGQLVLPTDSELVEWCRVEGFATLLDPLPWPEGRVPIRSFRHAWRVARFAGRDIDLIHCNEHNVYPFVFVLRKLIDVPVVCHVRYKLDREFTRWAFAGKRCPDALLWTSQQQRDDSEKAVAEIVPNSRQHLVRLGLDVGEFGVNCGQRTTARRTLGIEEDEVAVGMASPLRPRKRIHEFIDMARRLARQRAKTVFLIAGGPIPGEEGYRKQVELAIAESGLSRRLRWLGFLEPIEPFYHACDIQVSTSEYETFGNSVCEAMACARPVAAYRGGSVGEVIGEAGLIVDTGDLAGLTRAVDRLIVDVDLRVRLGVRARQRVAECFNPRNSFEQLKRIYESLLAGKAAA